MIVRAITAFFLFFNYTNKTGYYTTMLLENFYSLHSATLIDKDKWLVTIDLNPQHKIYEGHFPENPVLPGVCTIQIIKECAENVLNYSVRYEQIKSCKFLSLVCPTATTQLEFSLSFKTISAEKTELNAEGKTEGVDFIKIKSLLTKL